VMRGAACAAGILDSLALGVRSGASLALLSSIDQSVKVDRSYKQPAKSYICKN
jgi:hypothetical protein